MRQLDAPGQIIAMFSLILSVLLLMGGLVIDLGYSFHIQRMLQASADAGAVAGANILATQTGSNLNGLTVYNAVQAAVTLNAPGTVTWSANYVYYLNGTVTQLATVTASSTTTPPTTANGVRVQVAQAHPTFFARIAGIKVINESTSATAASLPSLISGQTATITYNPAIISLNRTQDHTILNNGTSLLAIQGNIIDDSNASNDTVDSFQTSSFVVEGTLMGVSSQPPDSAFYSCAPSTQCPGGTLVPGTLPSSLGLDASQYTCAQRGTKSSTECWQAMQSSISYVADPFAGMTEPTQTQAASVCGTAHTVTGATQSGTLTPGAYTGGGSTVTINGPATLGDCSGSPGVYYFPNGVVFNSTGGAITITDSMIFSAGKAGITMKGTGTITDRGPTAGTWEHMTLFQDRNTPANISFNPTNSDTGTVSVVGTVYTHDYANDLKSATNLVQIGTSGGQTGTGAGTVNIDGTAVCDEFLTDGSGSLTIKYDVTEVPPSNSVFIIS